MPEQEPIDWDEVERIEEELRALGFNKGPLTCEALIESARLRETVPPAYRHLINFTFLLTHELIVDICTRLARLETTDGN